jgi:hypothetical protein
MENLRDLNSSELIEISGGESPAYDLGYAIGSFVKDILLLKSIRSFFI